MSDETNNGHRRRLDRKVRENGFDSLEPHEQLEYILYAVIPRKNVNKEAHELIDRFGSLWGVFNADVEQLIKFKGIGTRAIKFLKILPEIAGITERTLRYNQPPRLFTEKEIMEFASTYFYGKVREKAYIFNLSSSFILRSVRCISNGGESHAPMYYKDVVKLALLDDASVVLVVHNHPGGNAVPSFEDISLSRQLNDGFAAVDIKLLDSVIISGEEYYSIRENGYLKKIKTDKDFENEYEIQLI